MNFASETASLAFERFLRVLVHFVREKGATMTEKTLSVEGMSCAHCKASAGAGDPAGVGPTLAVL